MKLRLSKQKCSALGFAVITVFSSLVKFEQKKTGSIVPVYYCVILRKLRHNFARTVRVMHIDSLQIGAREQDGHSELAGIAFWVQSDLLSRHSDGVKTCERIGRFLVFLTQIRSLNINIAPAMHR